MTCIVGAVVDGKVFVGGDSLGVSGYDATVRRDAKVFHVGPYLIGFTTSFRMGQLLQYKLAVPEQGESSDVMRHMVTTFVDAVRECLKDGGYAKTDNSVESGGDFLVGYQGRLFRVCADYQVAESVDGFDAIGCGEDYAKGALRATAQCANNLGPESWIVNALEATAHFSTGVGGPFIVESI